MLTRLPSLTAATDIARAVEQIETDGGTIVQITTVGDEHWIVWQPKPKPGRPAKPKVETR